MNLSMRFAGCLAALGVAWGAAGEVELMRVWGNEILGPYKHPAAITQLQNGDLYITYYGGTGEYEDDAVVWGTRLPAGDDEWTFPEVLADTPFLSEGNGIAWQAPDGLVWLFYVQRYGETWSDARVKAKVSEDNTETWSDSTMIAFEKGSMARGLPIVLEDGDYLLPLYHETGHDRMEVGPDTTSFFLRHDPETREWTRSNHVYSRQGNLQAEPAIIEGDHLVAYARRGGGYQPVDDGWMVRMESFDGGLTWNHGEETTLPNPNSAVSFIRLESGNHLLVYNDSMNRRTPLVAALSTDGDESYAYKITIGDEDNTYAYPMAIQAEDGTIHVVYTTDSRETIMVASFTEEYLLDNPLDEPLVPLRR